jgi:3-hydroxyisobutyrate dehydrogenase
VSKIAFLGLGNMGLPMALNLVRAGHAVTGFDLAATQLEAFAAHGTTATSAAACVADAEIIITMLPAGRHVLAVIGDVLPNARADALFIDCSTIDVDSARAAAAQAQACGREMLDAPVSGGVGGAAAGTLTFMVGGPDSAFARGKAVLEAMGKTIVHTGAAGAGQAAKICNNMILGISMIAVSEAFALAEKLGLDAQKLFDVSSKSSGQCWSLTSYCPVPGPVPASPANRDWQPGFAASLMLKDLTLSQQAAEAVGAATPLGAHAARLYDQMVAEGQGGRDFSFAEPWIAGKARDALS